MENDLIVRVVLPVTDAHYTNIRVFPSIDAERGSRMGAPSPKEDMKPVFEKNEKAYFLCGHLCGGGPHLLENWPIRPWLCVRAEGACFWVNAATQNDYARLHKVIMRPPDQLNCFKFSNLDPNTQPNQSPKKHQKTLKPITCSRALGFLWTTIFQNPSDRFLSSLRSSEDNRSRTILILCLQRFSTTDFNTYLTMTVDLDQWLCSSLATSLRNLSNWLCWW